MIVNTYYFNARPNFGDMLNVYLLKKLFNIDIKKASVNDCDATFIGSILSPFITPKLHYINNKPIKIWGSGFIKEAHNDNKFHLIRPIEVFAVRGELTKRRLEKYTNKKFDNAVLGDPGLLCSLAYKDINIKSINLIDERKEFQNK